MTKTNDPLVKDGWFMEKNEMWPGQGNGYFCLLIASLPQHPPPTQAQTY